MSARIPERPPGTERSGTVASLTDRLLGLRRLAEPAFSADGGWLAFSVSEAFRKRDRASQSAIWGGPLDGPMAPLCGETVPEDDHPGAADGLPRWAPAGTSLAFASDRSTPGSRGSIFTIDAGRPGDPPRFRATVDGTVDDIAWLSDTSLLALVADPEAESASMEAAVRKTVGGDDPRVVRPIRAWRRLLRIDLDSGATTEVGPADWTIWEFAIAPSPGGGTAAVAVGSEDPTENGWYRPSILWLDLDARAVRVLHRSAWQVASPTASPDGRRVAFVEGWASDRGLLSAEIRVLDTAGGELVAVQQADADVSWLRWRDEATLWFAGVHGLSTAYGWVGLDGRKGRAWTLDAALRVRHQAEIVPSQAGDRLVAVLDAPDGPPEIAWRPVDPDDAGWRRVTNVNADLADLADGRTLQRLTWTSTDEREIEGLVVVPTGVAPGPRPLVVNIHGGPTWSYGWSFLPPAASLAIDPGYALLLVNYRGTPGYGSDFTRANIGDPGGREFQDVLTGIDECVRRGIADPDRIAVLGGSYGGYLTAWALTQTTRFACGIVISGISDLLSCHRTCNNPRFFELITGMPPHGEEALMRYADRSPIAHIGNARTPALILHGEKDLCTPLGQAEEYFQGLAEQGVEVELVVYPREGHGAGNWEIEHQRDYAARMRDWLVRHLAAPSA